MGECGRVWERVGECGRGWEEGGEEGEGRIVLYDKRNLKIMRTPH